MANFDANAPGNKNLGRDKGGGGYTIIDENGNVWRRKEGRGWELVSTSNDPQAQQANDQTNFVSTSSVPASKTKQRTTSAKGSGTNPDSYYNRADTPVDVTWGGPSSSMDPLPGGGTYGEPAGSAERASAQSMLTAAQRNMRGPAGAALRAILGSGINDGYNEDAWDNNDGRGYGSGNRSTPGGGGEGAENRPASSTAASTGGSVRGAGAALGFGGGGLNFLGSANVENPYGGPGLTLPGAMMASSDGATSLDLYGRGHGWSPAAGNLGMMEPFARNAPMMSALFSGGPDVNDVNAWTAGWYDNLSTPGAQMFTSSDIYNRMMSASPTNQDDPVSFMLNFKQNRDGTISALAPDEQVDAFNSMLSAGLGMTMAPQFANAYSMMYAQAGKNYKYAVMTGQAGDQSYMEWLAAGGMDPRGLTG